MDRQKTFDYLTSYGIKPSMQRIAVMDFLLKHMTHPSADEIYSALMKEMPTLSRTTVYNTLKILVEYGAVNQLTIDDRSSNFDADMHPHAHFLCTECGKVYDVPLRVEDLGNEAMIPEGFRMDKSSLYYRGICKDCLKKREAKKAVEKAGRINCHHRTEA